MAKRPMIPEDMKTWNMIRQELINEPDRGAAIVGAAMVHDCLREAILSRFVHKDDDILDQFRSGSPLNSFWFHAQLAYGLGFIGPNIFGDLRIIRDIRNKFAHWTFVEDSKKQPEKLTFQNQQIMAWAAQLYAPKFIQVIVDGTLDTEHLENVQWEDACKPDDSRDRYVVTCIFVARALESDLLWRNSPASPKEYFTETIEY